MGWKSNLLDDSLFFLTKKKPSRGFQTQIPLTPETYLQIATGAHIQHFRAYAFYRAFLPNARYLNLQLFRALREMPVRIPPTGGVAGYKVSIALQANCRIDAIAPKLRQSRVRSRSQSGGFPGVDSSDKVDDVSDAFPFHDTRRNRRSISRLAVDADRPPSRDLVDFFKKMVERHV